MKSIIINMTNSKKFFIYVLKRLLQEPTQDYQQIDTVNNLIGTLEHPSNIHKPNYYSLSMFDCDMLVDAVAAFLNWIQKRNQVIMDNIQKEPIKKAYQQTKALQKYINIDYQCILTMQKIWQKIIHITPEESKFYKINVSTYQLINHLVINIKAQGKYCNLACKVAKSLLENN